MVVAVGAVVFVPVAAVGAAVVLPVAVCALALFRNLAIAPALKTDMMDVVGTAVGAMVRHKAEGGVQVHGVALLCFLSAEPANVPLLKQRGVADIVSAAASSFGDLEELRAWAAAYLQRTA